MENIPKNWPDHLDAAIKHLSDRILPALKFLPNKLLLGIPMAISTPINPDSITPPTEVDATLHLAVRDQQQSNGYATIVSHAEKRKKRFNNKVMKQAPRNVVFEKDDLVQIHQTQRNQMFLMIRKLIPMWSTPHHVDMPRTQQRSMKPEI